MLDGSMIFFCIALDCDRRTACFMFEISNSLSGMSISGVLSFVDVMAFDEMVVNKVLLIVVFPCFRAKDKKTVFVCVCFSCMYNSNCTYEYLYVS